MFRTYSLEPLNGVGPALQFEWDPSTESVRGEGADYVRAVAAHAQQVGYMLGHPYPTPYSITNPLSTPAELAVILGNVWRLTEDLAAAYPASPVGNEPPDGALA